MTETELRRVYVAEATKAFPDARFFIRNVGKFMVGDIHVRAGIKGQADVECILRGGRHVEIELKNICTPQTPEQKAWQSFCETWGIPYLLLRALSADPIAQWIGETRTFLDGVVR